MFAQYLASFTEFEIDRPDIFWLSGHESPSRTRLKCLRIFFQALRRISLRVDGHREHKDIFADEIANLVLDLRQSRRRQRTNIGATRVDEADDDDLALDQVIVESHRFSILGD